ncbi:MAG: CRISPR-associated protein Cas4 [Spirochaetaceae bacterium]|nr:CRISPR-associated protein Cas4 [Spirochaetaceae bacterium]
MHNTDTYFLISGLQHFTFCRRRWALIYIEQVWADNALTIQGALMHEKAHNPLLTDKRGNVLISREMPIISHKHQMQGNCDIVEFIKADEGVPLFGREGLWQPTPIEYKKGKGRVSGGLCISHGHEADSRQLCAQAMCLEEMLCCKPIETAYIYYGEIKRREPVAITVELRQNVANLLAEMRNYYARGYVPKAKPAKHCDNCSLKEECLPNLAKRESVKSYLANMLSDDD